VNRRTNKTPTYAVEIPTRDEILEALGDEGVPMAADRLAARLGVEGPEALDGFERRVAAMERDGQVVRNRRGHVLISDRAGLVKGKVFGHPDGYGFLRPESGKEDLYLSSKEMHKVLHGDVVLARVSGVVVLHPRPKLRGSVVRGQPRRPRRGIAQHGERAAGHHARI